ncbi:hypothetical protein TRIUR3_02878 [Triticum urartu]|uniref:Uncharacterized protein n=1 Tax=Triticum urartu TaxID=4572 RepID=M7ZXJ6_TRIUA|nr:hypothetical protein TRIUR3_02878 [Triticum urartu]
MWLAGPDPARLPRQVDMLLAAQAQTFLYTADVVTAVENFPDHGGTVNGILKLYVGSGFQRRFYGKESPQGEFSCAGEREIFAVSLKQSAAEGRSRLGQV